MAEESFYEDKSRVKWLTQSDTNTTFFHKKLKIYQAHNKILTLANANGEKLTKYNEVKKKVVEFFQKLFTEL